MLNIKKDFRSFTKENENVTLIPRYGTRAVRLELPDEDFRYGCPNR